MEETDSLMNVKYSRNQLILLNQKQNMVLIFTASSREVRLCQLSPAIMFLIAVVNFRALPSVVGLDKLAQSMEKFQIGGLLIVGGFEVSAVT